MGLFAELLHLHPWDIDRLTIEQFDDYCRYVDERLKEMKG